MRSGAAMALCLLLTPCCFLAQGGFTNVSNEQGIDIVNSGPTWGAGVSFYDFDNDGWDDLSFPLNNDSLTFYKNNNGVFTQMPSFGPNAGDAKQILWFDMENDGDSDVLITYNLAQTLLFRNDGDWTFTDITDVAGIPSHPIAKSYGAGVADYDKDGYLDIYITNYNWPSGPTNWLLHNNGDGTFDEVSEVLGVDNDVNPSFQVSWLDYNNDTWPDIYVINDKDPENALYKNNGDGTFTDVSEESGADIVVDAMSNAICDFDNNGTLDIYVTNSSVGNYLLSNNGDGTFDNIALESGLLVEALTWGALWIDYDNDMDDDIHIMTTYLPLQNRNPFYENQGDGTFEDITVEVGLYQDTPLSFGNAKGDFNNDGFSDMALANTSPNTCFLYQNDSDDNHHLKIGLTGVVSNRDAVGTWLTYFVNGNKYVEYTICGENYLGQDSQREILGLGAYEALDSLVVSWPSGLVETYYDVAANQTIELIEGASLQNTITADALGICPGDSIVLDAGNYESFQWSTGDTTQWITLWEPQEVQVIVTDEFGFDIHSLPMIVEAFEATQVTFETTGVSCNGDLNGSAALVIDDETLISSTLWSSQDSTLIAHDLPPGTCFCEWTDVNGCAYLDSIIIEQPEPLCMTDATTHVSCFGGNDGSSTIEPCGGSGEYEIDWLGVDPMALYAGEHEFVITDSNNCSETLMITVDQPNELLGELNIVDQSELSLGSAQLSIEGGVEPYSIAWSSGSQELEAIDLSAGTYTVSVEDAHNCHWQMDFEIDFVTHIEHLANAGVSFYPNPATDVITIEGLKCENEYQAQIISCTGTVIKSQDILQTQRCEIDLTELSSGSYFLRIRSEDQHHIWRMLITTE